MTDRHAKIWPGHFVIERKRSERFWDWFYNYNWRRTFRLLGIFIIYFTILDHFKIDFSIGEASLIGLGIGLIVD